MSVEKIAAAEHRLHLAEDALSAAAIRHDRQSISLHEFRVKKAQEALYRARHAEEIGDCTCPLCRGDAA